MNIPSPSLSRRQALRSMSSGFGYLAFSALAHEAAAKPAAPLEPKKTSFPARAKRVIFLCMKGGPSHLDLLDYKPGLAKHVGKTAEIGKYGKGAKVLGPVKPFRQHGDSGLWMTDLLPGIAKHADDICVINSMHTDLPNHPQAFGQMHTGSFQFVRPSIGAWTLYGLGSVNSNLPGFITLNPPADFGGAQNYGNAFLPSVCQGTKIGGSELPGLYAALMGKREEPGPPMKNLTNVRISRQLQRSQIDLVQSLDRMKLARDQWNPEVEGAIESFELGFRMQDEVPEVLDIAKEPESVRKMYGMGDGVTNEQFAKQCLLARRLAEAGVRFIEVTAPVNWDHHFFLRSRIAETCAETDQAVSGLLEDLKLRGMLDDTLVIWAGEFGRTPYGQGPDGRDHNNKGYSLWMAGGGVKGGMAFGATDEFGYKAVENPVHIHDWHATVLHLLGLDHKNLTFNYGGRDFRLTDVDGNVVGGIVA